MKTVLINVFDTAVAKNILMPAFLKTVRESDVRCVIAVPEAKLSEFSAEYADSGLEFAPRRKRHASFLENMSLFAARNAIPTHTVRQMQEEGIDGSGKLPVPKYVLARTLWFFGHSYRFRAFLKRIVTLPFDTDIFDDLFVRYKPDLVFATSLYALDDLRLLKAARMRGIRTLGMVKSWDNFTSKDLLLIPPERLLVHNDVVKEEAMRLHRYPSERVSVVGVPQFDWYADPTFVEARDAFFSRLGLDAAKKLITYNAMGNWLVPHERDVIALLYRIVSSGALRHPSQLLVRMHPAYPDEKAALQKLFPHIVVDEPGKPERESANAWKVDWKFSLEDIRHLASTLKYSDVTLNCGSTTLIDAACCEAPTVGIAFDGEAHEPSYWRSARRLFEREHCKKALESGGIALVRSEHELTEALNAYLADRLKDREGRARLVWQQAGELGKASERLARAMLQAANY
jgi:hypothetical protein